MDVGIGVGVGGVRGLGFRAGLGAAHVSGDSRWSGAVVERPLSGFEFVLVHVNRPKP